jgi:hypothetical protein
VRRPILALALALAGCDLVDDAFLNSIPVTGTRTDDMHVFIAYDGLAPSTVDEATARGAFAGPQWRRSRFVTAFPGTSDLSWTRILRTRKMSGYEYEYYDPTSDKLVNAGLLGLLKHILPAFSETLSYEAGYLRAFDYRSNGYSHNLGVYSNTWVSLGESLDELFFALDSRAQTDNVFLAYLMEGDVLGHTGKREDCTSTLLRLAARIEAFRAAHPRRTFRFTLLSDHGMDFHDMPVGHFLEYEDELRKVGIESVSSLGGRDPSQGVYAVPILHVRLMYFALHTHPELIAEVGQRASQLESVDFVAGRLGPSRYGLWSDGRLAGTFEHADGTYQLEGDFSRFGIPEGLASASDEELFALTNASPYPDLLYRLRTALSQVGLSYPADLIASTRSGWQSAGAIPLPSGSPDTLVTGGTHGGANADGVGALVSEEPDLPDAIRADAFLDLFPLLATHLTESGIELLPTDADASRPHR